MSKYKQILDKLFNNARYNPNFYSIKTDIFNDIKAEYEKIRKESEGKDEG